MNFQCVRCSRPFPVGYVPFCDQCGAMIEVSYDLEKVTLPESTNPLVRFADLLPIQRGADWPPVALTCTPCIHALRLGARLGLPRLYLKNETVLPTGTTKYRMALVALKMLADRGVRAFAASSTGNSSTAFAQVIPYFPALRMFLFTAERFRDRAECGSTSQVTHFVLRDGTFVEAFICAANFAVRHGIVSERGFFNPGRREGLKLAFLEAAEQVPGPIDWYVQAVSSAMGVYGAFKGARELLALGRISRLPRLLCVQQETCAPLVRAFEEGSEIIRPEHIVARPEGIAEAILRGDPSRVYPYVRGIVLESDGGFVAVSEAEIREARRIVEDLENVAPCFSASAAVAGLMAKVRQGLISSRDTVLVNLTGSDRAPGIPGRVHWLDRRGDGWEPEGGESETAWQASRDR
jgi:threonine synthase